MFKDNKVYSFSDLKSILSESKGEFKAKVGKGYSWTTDGKNNEKAVKDIAKQVTDFDGGLQDKVERKTNPENITDGNKTTLDYSYSYEPSEQYKERVKALAHGYSSKSEEDNSKNEKYQKAANFDGNSEFYEQRSEIKEKDVKANQEYKHAGLKSHNLPKETFKDKTLYTESIKMKRLHFKNTTFLNEQQVLKRVPEDYKIDGNKFIMKDSKGNEYLVECKKDSLCESYIHTNVVSHNCGKQSIDEALNKFYHLTGYKSSDYNTKVEQLTESAKYNDMLEITRKLKEETKK